MDKSHDQRICDILNEELVCALGCTEPIAVAYAAALATETLGCEPEHITASCSGNIIKNVKSVTVPNSGGMHGIEAAATLGAVGGNPHSALEVLEGVDDADHERLLRALALSDLVAIHVKSYIGALSAFCGVVCAACGAGAAITWMAGGTREQIGATVVNTLGNVGGIVCDGAKSSCAAKISAAVDAAILGHDMAMAGCSFRAGEGLVQKTVEETIASMGYVGRVGMQPTDVEILNIMIGKTEVDPSAQ